MAQHERRTQLRRQRLNRALDATAALVALEVAVVAARVFERVGQSGDARGRTLLIDGGVDDHPVQPRGECGAAVELYEVGGSIPRRKLHQAEPIANDVEPQRLRIDGDAFPETEAGGEVVLVQDDRSLSHRCRALALVGCDGQPSRIRPNALTIVHL